jgi:hypothetical protein
MMSNRAWLAFVLLALGIYCFVVAAAVKNFRYKYGGFPVPRLVGRIVFVLMGATMIWCAMEVALQS